MEYRIRISLQFLEESLKLLLSSIYEGITELRIHFILMIILQYTNNITIETKFDCFHYFQRDLIISLFHILFQGWDEVRDIIMTLLLEIPISKYNEIDVNEILKWLLIKTKSFRPKDCDGSGKLLYFIYSKYVVESNMKIDLLNSEVFDKESESCNNDLLKKLSDSYIPQNNQLLFINDLFILLLKRLPLCIIERGNYDELNISNIPTVEGLLCCLKYIYNSSSNNSIIQSIPNEMINTYLNVLYMVYRYV